MKKQNIAIVLFMVMSLINASAMLPNSSSKRSDVSRNVHYYPVNVVSDNEDSKDDDSNDRPSSSAILSTAEDTLGDSSEDMPGTSHGRLACASMVSSILKRSGVHGINSPNTSDMYRQLENSSQFERVSISSAKPGDIIISPSEGRKIGHVGIVGRHGQVYSNNSYSARFKHDFTVKTWKKYFVNYRDLDVYVYRKV